MGPAGLWGRSLANPKSMIFTGAPGVSSAYKMFYRREAGDSQGQGSAQGPGSPAPQSGARTHLGFQVTVHHARLLVHEAHGRHQAPQDLAGLRLAEEPLLADVLQQLPAPQQLQDQVSVQLRRRGGSLPLPARPAISGAPYSLTPPLPIHTP